MPKFICYKNSPASLKLKVVKNAMEQKLYHDKGFFKLFFTEYLNGRYHDITEIFTIRVNKKLVGICLVVDSVIMIYINTYYRKKGLGKALIQFALKHSLYKDICPVKENYKMGFWLLAFGENKFKTVLNCPFQLFDPGVTHFRKELFRPFNKKSLEIFYA